VRCWFCVDLSVLLGELIYFCMIGLLLMDVVF